MSGSSTNPIVIDDDEDNNSSSSNNNNSDNNQGRPLAKYNIGDTVLYVSGRVVNRNRNVERIGLIIRSRWNDNGEKWQYMMRNSQQSLSGSSVWINENQIIEKVSDDETGRELRRMPNVVGNANNNNNTGSSSSNNNTRPQKDEVWVSESGRRVQITKIEGDTVYTQDSRFPIDSFLLRYNRVPQRGEMYRELHTYRNRGMHYVEIDVVLTYDLTITYVIMEWNGSRWERQSSFLGRRNMNFSDFASLFVRHNRNAGPISGGSGSSSSSSSSNTNFPMALVVGQVWRMRDPEKHHIRAKIINVGQVVEFRVHGRPNPTYLHPNLFRELYEIDMNLLQNGTLWYNGQSTWPIAIDGDGYVEWGDKRSEIPEFLNNFVYARSDWGTFNLPPRPTNDVRVTDTLNVDSLSINNNNTGSSSSSNNNNNNNKRAPATKRKAEEKKAFQGNKDCAICGQSLLGNEGNTVVGSSLYAINIDTDDMDATFKEVIILNCCGNGIHVKCLEDSLNLPPHETFLGLQIPERKGCPICTKPVSFRKPKIIKKEVKQMNTVTEIALQQELKF